MRLLPFALAVTVSALAAPLGFAAGPGAPLAPIPTPDNVAAAADTPTLRTKARLSIVDVSPLTLRGTGFRSRESVRVVVALGKTTLVRQVHAGPRGAFTISLAGVPFERCGTPPAIAARGDRTGAVSLSGLPRDCAMP